MKYLIIWLVSFVLIYLLYLILVIIKKKKELNKNTYITYLVRVYHLNEKKLNKKKLIHIISIANAFIIATTFTLMFLVNHYLLMLLLAFVTLVPLQLLIYHILGKILQRREKKHE